VTSDELRMTSGFDFMPAGPAAVAAGIVNSLAGGRHADYIPNACLFRPSINRGKRLEQDCLVHGACNGGGIADRGVCWEAVSPAALNPTC
jgi:hypothetical protein